MKMWHPTETRGACLYPDQAEILENKRPVPSREGIEKLVS